MSEKKSSRWSLIMLPLIPAMVIWTCWHSFATPTGAVEGPAPSAGLPDTCLLVDRSLLAELVPDAIVTDRDLDRKESHCTLTGRARELRIEVSRSPSDPFGRRIDEVFGPDRSDLGRPATVAVRGLGDEAELSRGSDEHTAYARLVVVRDNVAFTVTYNASPAPSFARSRDLDEYATVTSGAERVTRSLLAQI